MTLPKSDREKHTEETIERVGRMGLCIVIIFGMLLLASHLFGIINLEEWTMPSR